MSASSMSRRRRHSCTTASERMRAFELALHPAKTRLIRFSGRAPRYNVRTGRGEARRLRLPRLPALLHAITQMGPVSSSRRTIKKRMLKQTAGGQGRELRKRMHDPIATSACRLKSDAQRYRNYYAVSGNSPSLWWYFNEVRWRWLKSLAMQPACIHALGEVYQHHRPLLPVDQDTTPAALSPLRRQNPREEPGALAAHAGIRAGGGWQQPSLP